MADRGRGATAGSRYGPFHRIVLVIVGTLMAFAGTSVVVLLAIFCAQSLAAGALRGGSFVKGAAATIAGALLFASFAAIGIARVVAGLRGHPSSRIAVAARAEAWCRRNWYPANLAFCSVLLGGVALSSPRAVFESLSAGPSLPRIVWFAFLGLSVLPVHVALHELGHAAAGAVVGYRQVETRVGWFSLRHVEGRIRLQWSPPSIAGVLGLNQALPQDVDAFGFRRAFYGIAGPMVTLAVAGGCLALTGVVGSRATGAAIASDVLWTAFWIGVWLGVGNLLPFRLSSGLFTDGAVVLTSLLPGSPAQTLVHLFQVKWGNGLRPREWGISSDALLRGAESEPRHRDTLLLASLAVAVDAGEEAEVEEILRRFDGAAPTNEPLMRYELELQIAMIEAFRGDTAAARSRLDRVGHHPHARDYACLAEAAVDASEGRLTEAAAGLDRWERAAAMGGMGHLVRVGNEWALEKLRARLAHGSDT